MKNAKQYEPGIRKLLTEARKHTSSASDKDQDPVRMLVRGVLSANATPKQAEDAVEAVESEFVDFNELRASPVKDLTDRLGREHPRRRAKAGMLTGALNAIFERTGSISMDYMHKMPKRDLRRHLRELGLDTYAAAYVTLFAFGGHAVPVDEDLAEILKMDELVHEESDIEDIQGFLERVVPQKDAENVHAYFRNLLRRKMPALTRRRREQAEAQAKAEAAAEKKRLEEEKAAADEKAAAEKAKKKKATKAQAKRKKASKKSGGKKSSSGAKKTTKKAAKTSKAKKTSGGAKKSKKSADRKKSAAGGKSSSGKKKSASKKKKKKAKNSKKTSGGK